MAIPYHPSSGTILLCDFNGGFREPEMVKRRPVVVLSPKIKGRSGLCTVVCLSTRVPDPVMPYHMELEIEPPLPNNWHSESCWVKGDMVYSVGFHRLDLIATGRDARGKRLYRVEPLNSQKLKKIKTCVLRGLGLSSLTKHL